MYVRAFTALTVLLLLLSFVQGEEQQSFDQAVSLLRSRYLSDRESGAAILDDISVVSAKQLIGLLSEPDARVATYAASALIKRKETEAVPGIFELMRRSSSSCVAILALLPEMGSDGYDPYLFDLAQSQDELVAESAIQCLSRFVSMPAISGNMLPILCRMLRSGSLASRMTAESILSSAGASAIPALLQILAEPFPANISACIALSKMGSVAAEALLEFLRTNGCRGTESVLAAEALCSMEPPPPVESVSWLLNSPNELVRARTAGSLHRLSVADSGTLFNSAVNDSAAAVRASALVALAKMKEPPLLLRADLIVSRLGDAFSEVRAAALSAASNFKLRAAVPQWPMLMKDPSREIVANALWTAGNLGDASLAPALRPFLASSGPERIAAAKSMLQLGLQEGQGVLVAALDSDNPPRKYAIYALSFARGREAVDEILKRVRSYNPEDLQVARYALFSITGAMLEIPEWQSWWSRYSGFWSPAERVGIADAFIGELYEKAGLFQVAREYYDRAAELAPSYPKAHDGRARMLLMAGDQLSAKAALEEATKAVTMLPLPEFYLTQAQAFIGLGMDSEALAAVQKGLSLPERLPALVEMEKILLGRSPR